MYLSNKNIHQNLVSIEYIYYKREKINLTKMAICISEAEKQSKYIFPTLLQIQIVQIFSRISV